MKQMHALAAAAGPYEPMIRLLSDCGLRLGELPGLERKDIAPGWLHIARTAHEGEVQAGTKTTHHKPQEEQGRDVPLPPATEALLRKLPPRIDTPLLFPTKTGLVWRERNWRRDVWEPACKAAGLDPRPQEFRASWESIMRAEGVDAADLAKYAGHSVQTANAHYVQALDRSAEQVRKVIG
jgi:integrase